MSRKWEIEYKKFRDGIYGERFFTLGNKIDDKTCSKKEYEEFKKLDAIFQNLDGVEHILELREKMMKEIEEINKELSRRKNTKDFDKIREGLEKENADLLLEAEEINSKLKNKELSEDERKDLENKKEENAKKRTVNNQKFLENENEAKDGALVKETELMKKDKLELEKRKVSLSKRISKCNMACNNLMQGKSWTAVAVKLQQWEKYTGKKSELEKMKASESASKENVVKSNVKENIPVENIENKVEVKEDEKEVEESKQRDEEAMVPVEEKPKWYQFIKRFKAWRENRKNAKGIGEYEKTSEPKVHPKVQDEMKDVMQSIGDEVKEIKEDKEDKEFDQLLEEVYRKGLDGIEQEKAEKEATEKAKRMVEKSKFLKDIKVEKANELAQKYGGRYETQDGATDKKDKPQNQIEDDGREPGDE